MFLFLFLIAAIPCFSMDKTLMLERKPVSLKMFSACKVVKDNLSYATIPMEIAEYVDLLKNYQHSMSELLQQSIMHKTEHFEDLLLLRNAKKWPWNKLPQNLFCTAILFDNATAIEYLLSHNIDPNMTLDKEGNTALMYLARDPKAYESVDVLLKHGADPSLCNSRGENALMFAAKNNNVLLLPRLIQAGTDINACIKSGGNKGITALTLAIKWKAQEAMNELLKAGADTNKQGDSGEFPLIEAIHDNNLDLVKDLVEHGADVKRGSSFYHGSSLDGVKSIAVADYLLQQGADIDAEDVNGYTPLMRGCCRGKYDNNYEILNWLLQNKVLINKQNRRGETALHSAASDDNTIVIKKLLDADANPHIKDNQGRAAWTQIARYGYTELIQAIKKRSFIELFQDKQEIQLLEFLSWSEGKGYECCSSLLKKTLLHKKYMQFRKEHKLFDTTIERLIAIFSDDTHMLQRCVDQGMNVKESIVTGKKITPLMVACYAQSTRVIEYLLARGVSTRLQNENDGSSLWAAVQTNKPAIIKLLLQFGADINEQQKYYSPIIVRAIQYKLIESCKFLLNQQELDINVRSHSASALEAAIKSDNNTLFKLVFYDKRLAKPIAVDALNAAISRKNYDIIEALLPHVDINEKEHLPEYDTPLYYAVLSEDERIVSLLLNKKPDVAARDFFGNTPFLKGIFHNKPKTLHLLLQHNTDVIHAKANGGYTALMRAVRNNDPINSSQLLQWLLDNKADPFARDDEGKTALQHAYLTGKLELVEILRNGMRKYKREKRIN